MRSLFFRVFWSFWGTALVLGALLVALAMTSDPRQLHLERYGHDLRDRGAQVAAALRGDGAAAARALQARWRAEGREPVFLFRDGAGPVGGGRVPRPVRRLAARCAATGEAEILGGRHGVWLALPLDEELAVLSRVPPPSRLERWLNPYGLGLRLAGAFVVIGLASWLLARYLSAPLRALRDATRRLAAGDLGARVGPLFDGRRDETAELAREFDRMAERVEAGVAARTRLLRDVSHELRSPLARLNVALELARDSAGDAAAGDLDRIGREAERLNELIGELLGLAALEGGAALPPPVPVALDELLRQVVADAGVEAAARGVTVRLDAPEAASLPGVPELLRRALENVVRNAVLYTAAGTEVAVRLVTGAGDGPLRVTVRDRGPGVPETALPQLFRPFYRVAEARERDTGGAGIGLAIAEQAVAAHGGRVWAENAPGGGLQVTLELPGDGSQF